MEMESPTSVMAGSSGIAGAGAGNARGGTESMGMPSDASGCERLGKEGAYSMRDALNVAVRSSSEAREAREPLGREIEDRLAAYWEFMCSWRDMDRGELEEMLAHGETIIHIPARAGSTRVKDKNIARLGGHPLLAYSVVQGLGIPGVDRVIVDTDSPGYAGIAAKYGAQVLYLRPSGMANTTAPLFDSLRFLLAYLYTEHGVRMKRIITLLATNPFRSKAMLSTMASALDHSSHCITYQDVGLDMKNIYYEDSGILHPMSPSLNGACRLNRSFKMTGHVQGRDDLSKIVRGRSTYLYRVEHPCELIDIDSEEDLDLAQRVIEDGLYDFGGGK